MSWIARQRAEKHSGHDAGGSLDELTDELLRCALRATADDATFDAPVCEAIHRVCEAAHTYDVHAEALLIIIKARWRQLPEVTRAMSVGKDALLARVISSCIRVFYSRDVPSENPR